MLVKRGYMYANVFHKVNNKYLRIHTLLQHGVDDLSVLHELQVPQENLLKGSNALPVVLQYFT